MPVAAAANDESVASGGETKIDDLRLPNAVVARLVKEALPPGVVVTKEARTAIARAAAVFILHATNAANEHAMSAKRKTLNAADVIHAVEELECQQLLASLQESVDKWIVNKNQKKEEQKKVKQMEENDARQQSTTADEHDEDMPLLMSESAEILLPSMINEEETEGDEQIND